MRLNSVDEVPSSISFPCFGARGIIKPHVYIEIYRLCRRTTTVE